MDRIYSIVSAYKFKDDKTKTEKICVQCILQTTKYPVKGLKAFYFEKSEAESLFPSLIDYEEKTSLWLNGYLLSVTEKVSLVVDENN